MATLLQVLGVHDIRDVPGPQALVFEDRDFTDGWIATHAVINPSAMAAPTVEGVAAELLDGPAYANGVHEIRRAIRVIKNRTYLFSLACNIARAQQQNGDRQRGLGFFITGAPFAPSADDAFPGPGYLVTSNNTGGANGAQMPPMWGDTGHGLIPEFQYLGPLWSRLVFSARAIATGTAELLLLLNGQNSGNFAPIYDPTANPLTDGIGVAECQVRDISGRLFAT